VSNHCFKTQNNLATFYEIIRLNIFMQIVAKS